jgi:hypothetical protein
MPILYNRMHLQKTLLKLVRGKNTARVLLVQMIGM